MAAGMEAGSGVKHCATVTVVNSVTLCQLSLLKTRRDATLTEMEARARLDSRAALSEPSHSSCPRLLRHA